MKERPYSCKEKCPEGWRPLYIGKDISRYQINSPQNFVNYGPWLAAPRKPVLFKSPKILMRRTDDKIKAAIENYDAVCVNSCHVIKFKDEKQPLSYDYILGILNSKLIQKIFELMNPQMVGKVFAEIKVIYAERLPVKNIDFKNNIEKQLYLQIDSLVKKNTELHLNSFNIKDPNTLKIIKRQINTIEKQIDQLVYQLYGLTDEEIKIVESEAL